MLVIPLNCYMVMNISLNFLLMLSTNARKESESMKTNLYESICLWHETLMQSRLICLSGGRKKIVEHFPEAILWSEKTCKQRPWKKMPEAWKNKKKCLVNDATNFLDVTITLKANISLLFAWKEHRSLRNFEALWDGFRLVGVYKDRNFNLRRELLPKYLVKREEI